MTRRFLSTALLLISGPAASAVPGGNTIGGALEHTERLPHLNTRDHYTCPKCAIAACVTAEVTNRSTLYISLYGPDGLLGSGQAQRGYSRTICVGKLHRFSARCVFRDCEYYWRIDQADGLITDE